MTDWQLGRKAAFCLQIFYNYYNVIININFEQWFNQ